MNIGCQHLEDYLDGLLDPELCTSFETHLADCVDCQSKARIASELNDRIREAWSAVESPGDLKQNILNPCVINTNWKYDEPRPNTRRIVVSACVLAASIVVYIAITQLLSFQPPVDPGTSQQVVANGVEKKAETRNFATAPSRGTKTDTDSVVSISTFDRNTKTISVVAPRMSSNFTIVNTYSRLNLKTALVPERSYEHEYE